MKSRESIQAACAFSRINNPTGKHKDWYGLEFCQVFCKEIDPSEELFEHRAFVKQYSKEYSALELKGRLGLFAALLREYLPGSFPDQLKILRPLLKQSWPFETGMLNYGYFLYPVSQFVEEYGVDDFSESMAFIESLTQCFTGEFAVRSLLERYPSKGLAQMKKWRKNKNFHVRRLSCEGLRPRLPWGQKITWVNESPHKIIPICTHLKTDPVLYVRRSVANTMGDVAKLRPELALKTFEEWLEKDESAQLRWVVRHASRYFVKKRQREFTSLVDSL